MGRHRRHAAPPRRNARSAPVRAALSSSPPRVSIVVVTYNSAADLPFLVNSLRAHTDEPYELIVVDNGSRDGTREILAGLEGSRVVLNQENAGFPRATNQGIALARGEFLVLLNPDTAVTPGWTRRLRAHLAPGVGAVGPVSNYVWAGQHLVRHLNRPFGDTITIEEVAALLAGENGGRASETRLLTGFCLMLPREVVRRVGRLDEDLFLGNDDLEYCWRLRREGYRLLIARDVFVYHRGQASFASEPPERTAGLVQQSSDALQRKLEIAYGAGHVPAPETMWGIGWFRPSCFRHPRLDPAAAARLERVRAAGGTVPPLAFALLDEVRHGWVMGPASRAPLRGLGEIAWEVCDPWEGDPASRIAPYEVLGSLEEAHDPEGPEAAVVLGVPPGLDEGGADALLTACETRARRQVILYLPWGQGEAGGFRAALEGTPGMQRGGPPLPAAWSAAALRARGYDLAESPDLHGFESGALLAVRTPAPADRQRVVARLAGYHHPQLVHRGAPVFAAPAEAPSSRAEPLLAAAAC